VKTVEELEADIELTDGNQIDAWCIHDVFKARIEVLNENELNRILTLLSSKSYTIIGCENEYFTPTKRIAMVV